MVLRVHEKSNPAGRVENLHELPQSRNEQRFSYSLTLVFPGDCQPAKPDPRHLTRQLPGLFRGKRLRSYLAEIEGEETQDGLW